MDKLNEFISSVSYKTNESSINNQNPKDILDEKTKQLHLLYLKMFSKEICTLEMYEKEKNKLKDFLFYTVLLNYLKYFNVNFASDNYENINFPEVIKWEDLRNVEIRFCSDNFDSKILRLQRWVNSFFYILNKVSEFVKFLKKNTDEKFLNHVREKLKNTISNMQTFLNCFDEDHNHKQKYKELFNKTITSLLEICLKRIEDNLDKDTLPDKEKTLLVFVESIKHLIGNTSEVICGVKHLFQETKQWISLQNPVDKNLFKWDEYWNFAICLDQALRKEKITFFFKQAPFTLEQDYFTIFNKINLFIEKKIDFYIRLFNKDRPSNTYEYKEQMDIFIKKLSNYLKRLLDKVQVEDRLRIYNALIKLNNTLRMYYAELKIKQSALQASPLKDFENLLLKFDASEVLQEGNPFEDLSKQEENNFTPLFVPLPQNLSPAQEEIREMIEAIRQEGEDIGMQIQNKRFEQHMETATLLYEQGSSKLIQEYKKIALLCHPDKWSQATVSEKEAAESMFKELTSVIEHIKQNWVVALKGYQSNEKISAENKEYYAQLDRLDERIYKIRKEREEILAAFRAEILEIRRTCLPHTLPKEVTSRAIIIYSPYLQFYPST